MVHYRRADNTYMGVMHIADRATSRKEDMWSFTREEIPRKFHVTRTVAIVVLAAVALFLPLGMQRIGVSGTLFIAGIILHTFYKRLPSRNLEGATQWVILAAIFACAALAPMVLPAATIAAASAIAGRAHIFGRGLNYLWLALSAISIGAIGLISSPPMWHLALIVFVSSVPGAIELGDWVNKRDIVQRRRESMLTELGQAITWERNLDENTALSVHGPVQELLGMDEQGLLDVLNNEDVSLTQGQYRKDGNEWVTKLHHADGSPRWFRVHGRNRVRADGANILYGVSVDITELETARLSAQDKAEHDDLTGLANRAGLAQFLDDEQDRVGRAVLVADIDRFKEINDTLGHLVGDRLIAAAAARLAELASPTHLVARLGGDEFAIAIVGDTAESVDADAEAVAVQLTAILTQPFAVQDMELRISVSTGIASGAELDWSELLRRADGAMYDAKRAGGGHRWYDCASDDFSVEKLRLRSRLNTQLEDEVVLHYQPVVSATTQELVGVEALARWMHPEMGLLFPDTFLPMIENTGMTYRFDRHVLRTAVETASELATSGQIINVSANLSPRSLWSPQLLVELRELLAAHPLAHDRLVIEVTEKGFLTDFSRSIPILESLRDMGVRLSLDDFGTGGSSLIRLRSLPFDEIKVDRSFVDGVPGDGVDATIVRSTIELAAALGMNTVAEGVESIDQASALAEMGCRRLQGWVFAKAMPLDELYETWVTSTNTRIVEPDAA